MAKALGLALAGMALFGVAAAAGAPDRIETLLEQAAGLEPDQQQRFLSWIESRLNRANTVILPAREAATARVALHRRLRRETVTWPELRQLLGELDRNETRAIEELARQYRLHMLLRTFRSSRDPTEQRQQAWLDVYAAWEAAGRPLAHQDELLDWLVMATDRSAAGLPAFPSFAADSLASLLPAMPTPVAMARLPFPEPAPASPVAAPDSPASQAVPEQPAPRTAPGSPASEVASDPVAPSVAPDPPSAVAGLDLPATIAEPATPAAPALPALAQRAAPVVDPLAPAGLTIRKRVAAFVAGGDGQTPTASDLAPVVSAATSGTVAPGRFARHLHDPRLGDLPVGNLPQKTALANATAISDTAAIPTMGASPAVPLATEPIPDTAASVPSVEKLRVLPGRQPLPSAVRSEDSRPHVAGPQRSQAVAERETALAGVEHRMSRAVRELPIRLSDKNGGVQEEASQDDQSPFIAEETLQASSAEQSTETEAGGSAYTQPAVAVNVQELRSRIAGTNMALRALEAELHERRTWNADELTPLVTRLHALMLRVEDMHLFREIVPEDTRRFIAVADSPRPAITLVAAKIAEARQLVVDGPYHGAETDRQAEMAQLDELSRRLVQIAEKTSR